MAESKINNILVTEEEDSPGSCRRIGNTITGSIPETCEGILPDETSKMWLLTLEAAFLNSK